jgi:hypothetical protein
MNKKIFSLILVALAAHGVVAQEVPAVSPAQAALDAARAAARAGDAETALHELEVLAATGFTTVSVITSDADLAKLAGNPEFDAYVEEMTQKAYPCESGEPFRAFDFWVGDWDVHLPDGRLAGTNHISREQRGCLLIENWQSASGGTGMSINYFDADQDQWVQVWNDPSGNQIDIRGGMTDDGMLLTGTIHYVVNDTTFPFRGLWTPLPDGRVRQYFEQANDGDGDWAPWFEGFYTRRNDGGKGSH